MTLYFPYVFYDIWYIKYYTEILIQLQQTHYTQNYIGIDLEMGWVPTLVLV